MGPLDYARRVSTADGRRVQGIIPLVIDVSSADIMATLIRLKNEVEERRGSFMRMVFSRATEAHLIAEEIGMVLSSSDPRCSLRAQAFALQRTLGSE